MKSLVTINSKISNFNSSIKVPGDKSISIRFVLLSSQAIGVSKAYNLLESDDVFSTINALKKLGVKIIKHHDYFEVTGVGLNGFHLKNKLNVNAGNSGTLSRILPGMLAKYPNEVKIVGDSSLSKRDFTRIVKPLSLFGVSFKKNKGLPLKFKGNNLLRPIFFYEKIGSAQVKTTCMFASLNTPGVTTLKCLSSRNHTELMFKDCLKIPIVIKKEKKFDIIKVKGQTQYNSFNYKIPGDISSAAFFIVLTILSKNSKLIIRNVNINRTRAGIIEILKRMKAKIFVKNIKYHQGEKNADIYISSTNKLKSIDCPKSLNTKAIDEFLIIFLVCAKAEGISKFRGIQELRKKESDRLKISSEFLKKLGVKVKVTSDSLTIYGNPKLSLNDKYTIKNFKKDHRVFMMSCIAALTLGGNFKIYDKKSINSSFPNFLSLLKHLGAKIK